MVNTCCVPGCNSGYKSNKAEAKPSLFRFPTDLSLRNKWVAAIPRKNWNVTENHRVCMKHFHADDFQIESSDNKMRRRNKRETSQLRRKRLKSTAVPKIFPGLPEYLSAPPIPERGTTSTASGRIEKENARIEQQNEEFLAADEIQDFSALQKELSQIKLPSGFINKTEEKQIVFYLIEEANNCSDAPKLLASVVIEDNLTISAYVSSVRLPQSTYQHLLHGQYIKSISCLSNLLAHCKSLADKSTANSGNFIDLAVCALQNYILVQTNKSETIANIALLNFIIEQLQLLFKPKEGRRYTTTLITMAFLWQLTSTSLYKKLRTVFILPSMSRLRYYSSGLSVESGLLDLSYLKERIKDLSEHERMVTLQIDEVYTAKRIEYNNGAFVGITEEGATAKTVLTFMIQSSCSKYTDVVCLVPVDKLDTNLLRSWFNKVMLALHDLVFVVAVSVDNHVCNRYDF